MEKQFNILNDEPIGGGRIYYVMIGQPDFDNNFPIFGSTPEEAKSRALAIVNAERMKEALEKMCKYHEKNASWDKGDNGYYEAKKLLNQTS